MANKLFDTVPPENDSTGDRSEGFEWHAGSLVANTRDIVIHYGAPKTWSRDTNWSTSTHAKLHETNAVTISGKNGRDHEGNFEQNISGWGRFIPMEFIYGFSIDFEQDSTAGHGLYLRNAGIECVKEDGSYVRWGSSDRSRQNDYSKHTATYMINSSDRQGLSAGNARFHRFICRLSTRGGSGDRTTGVTLGDFRLIYRNTGCTTGRWVLPSAREFTKRLSNQDIITI